MESCSFVSAQTGLPETAWALWWDICSAAGGLRERRSSEHLISHAMNLDLYARYIRLHYPDYVVVAIDASVGSLDHVGYATLGRGALQPGLGVSKELEAVGDIAITGIVGGVGSRDPVMLQSVRLSMVMKMADCICESIFLVERLWENAAII